MYQRLNDGDGIQALDANQLSRQLRYSVADGCTVSAGTNDLTVQVTSPGGTGTVILDGTRIDVPDEDNISLPAPDASNPRKDVVYVAADGSVNVAEGVAEPAQPSNEIRRATYRPAPPDLSATDAVVLAEVWVPTGASDITDADISDRRIISDAVFDEVSARSVDTGELSNNPPSAPFTWEGLPRLLQDGYCVSSLGNVYGPVGSDADAAQKAVDDAVNNGATKVWLGNGDFNGVKISTTNSLHAEVVGCGRDTYLDGGTSAPGLEVENPNYDQIGTARLRLRDIAATTSGNSHPGIRFDGAHEVWATRLMSQSPDGYGIHIEDSRRLWLTDCFSEGSPTNALRVDYIGNKTPGGIEANGGLLQTADDYVIELNDPNAPSGVIFDSSFACGVDYDQANYGWLKSNGGTNNVSAGGGGGMQSGGLSTTSDDDIATYGLS
jgi:hypothetical protein